MPAKLQRKAYVILLKLYLPYVTNRFVNLYVSLRTLFRFSYASSLSDRRVTVSRMTVPTMHIVCICTIPIRKSLQNTNENTWTTQLLSMGGEHDPWQRFQSTESSTLTVQPLCMLTTELTVDAQIYLWAPPFISPALPHLLPSIVHPRVSVSFPHAARNVSSSKGIKKSTKLSA